MDPTVFENVEEIICILRTIHITKEIDKADEEKLNKHYSVLSNYCYPKELKKSEDIPYNEEDFSFVAHNTLPYLKCVQRVLEELCICNQSLKLLQTTSVQRIILNALIIASQFQNVNYYWSDQECSAVAVNILDFLAKFSKSTSISDFLVGKECGSEWFNKTFPNSALKLFLCHFSEKITKKTWKCYPFYIESYVWILFNVKAPHLAEYISYLLPAALFILDDWEQRHKVIGIKALYYILINTPQSEVRWYGRAEVIYEALKHHIFSREHELLSHVYPAVILATVIIENAPQKANIKKTYYDAILSHLLREMSHEERLIHRTIYAKALRQLIEAMGIYIVRWSKDVLDVCSKYLATYEGEEAQDRKCILKALQIYIKNCWPRIHAHTEVILKMVLKLAYEISLDEPHVLDKETLILESKRVVQLLIAAVPTIVTGFCEGITDLNIPRSNYVKLVISDAAK